MEPLLTFTTLASYIDNCEVCSVNREGGLRVRRGTLREKYLNDTSSLNSGLEIIFLGGNKVVSSEAVGTRPIILDTLHRLNPNNLQAYQKHHLAFEGSLPLFPTIGPWLHERLPFECQWR